MSSGPDFCRNLLGNGYCPRSCRGGIKQGDLPSDLAEIAREDLINRDRPEAQRRNRLRKNVAKGLEKAVRDAGLPLTLPPCQLENN
ncbi:MAG TPA: hypothetical protein VEW42_00205 [Candidatus Eisenbacteria bacterium]|nr:hypothetical protein [Candidatus Eisenbacteria bacterium]